MNCQYDEEVQNLIARENKVRNSRMVSEKKWWFLRKEDGFSENTNEELRNCICCVTPNNFCYNRGYIESYSVV